MKISSRLMLAVGLASLVIIGALSSILIRAQHSRLIALDGEHARSVAETIRSSTRYAMLLNQREGIEQIIHAVGRQSEISDVRIFNKEGRIVYSADRSALGDVVEKDTAACIACHDGASPAERLSEERGMRFYRASDGRSTLGVILPIYNEASCAGSACHARPAEQAVLGVLDVSMPLDIVEQQLAASSRTAAIFAVTAILAISLIVWLVFRSLVARPVEGLLEATYTVASGDLEHRLEVRRDDELGQLAGSFNTMTSRLAEAQTQLYRSDRLASVGKLAAGVAHEINNPLTAVLTFSSLMLRAAPEGSEGKSDLETIVRETKRCREIVKGLLDFARQVPAQKTAVDINETIEWALEVIDHQLDERKISVTRSLGEHLPKVHADSNQMVQVLVNLLGNAADAMELKGGEIFIGTDFEEAAGRRSVVVKVADTGPGISAEHQERIFEPFFTTKGTKGTGLGLPVVWGILEEHGATIEVHSRPQRGATFTIELPAMEEAPGAARLVRGDLDDG
jgi:two-component system NtrC family sensor kinase